jgi:FecR protein
MNADLRDELDRLVSGVCENTLTSADCERLDCLLRSHDEARRFYNDCLFLHAELYSQHAAFDFGEFGSGGCNLLEEGSQFTPVQLAPAQLASRNSRGIGRLARWSVAAAVVAVAAGSSWLTYVFMNSGRQPQQLAAISAEVEPAESVAKITATRNCLWQATTKGVGFGSRLHVGERLELAAGLVEITFDDGATVVLEGPAKFDVGKQGHARLEEGRLAAVVPEQARGFEVATAGLNVVDLGTEFGLMADAQGATEIHVFNGLVKAQLLNQNGQQVRTVELNTAEAARIQPAAELVARIPARDDEFVRSLSVAAGPHDGLYAYDGFNYPSGPLGEQNGGFGWAGPWFNVEADAQVDANSNGVKLGSLDYEGLVPLGNRAVQSAHQNRIRRSLSTSVGGVFDAAGLVENQDAVRLVGREGTKVYLSFLQRVDKMADVFYGLELHRGDGNGNRVLCIGHGAEGTGYGATSNFNVYGVRNFPALGQENTEANFYVVRITFGPGNRDHVEVLRNPESLDDEGAAVVDAELTGNFAFDRIGLGNFHGTKIHEVDEIRVGTTFRAVTGRRSRGPDRLMPRVAELLRGDNTESWAGGRQMLLPRAELVVISR